MPEDPSQPIEEMSEHDREMMRMSSDTPKESVGKGEQDESVEHYEKVRQNISELAESVGSILRTLSRRDTGGLQALLYPEHVQEISAQVRELESLGEQSQPTLEDLNRIMLGLCESFDNLGAPPRRGISDDPESIGWVKQEIQNIFSRVQALESTLRSVSGDHSVQVMSSSQALQKVLDTKWRFLGRLQETLQNYLGR
jgi:hypothetical protein